MKFEMNMPQGASQKEQLTRIIFPGHIHKDLVSNSCNESYVRFTQSDAF